MRNALLAWKRAFAARRLRSCNPRVRAACRFRRQPRSAARRVRAQTAAAMGGLSRGQAKSRGTIRRDRGGRHPRGHCEHNHGDCNDSLRLQHQLLHRPEFDAAGSSGRLETTAGLSDIHDSSGRRADPARVRSIRIFQDWRERHGHVGRGHCALRAPRDCRRTVR